MPRLTSPLFALAIGAIGCAELPDDQLATTEQAVIDCETWVCGSNSPVIATYHFHELNTRGLPNAEGFSLVSLWQAGTNYQLAVEQGKIYGRLGSLELKGAALVGAQIRVRRGVSTYAIRIAAVGTMQTFAKLGGTSRTLETYQLDVTELLSDQPTTPWRNLCSQPPARDNPDVLGMNVFHSLVFEGERIDKVHKTISTALDPTWFNIGCAGHALAKLAINAHTEAAHQAFGFATTILERQAFLKMLTGDYCGTGKSFTVSGQPVQWTDWHGYTKYVSAPANLELEARWSPSGATCLSTPRVDANPTQLGINMFGGNVMSAIVAECGLRPVCAGDVGLFDGKPLLSANPL